ncbi:MAG: hypothetical protein VYA34_08140, partial [Myxococcota bacterium]|nr:hypothetical protein [Myxococcota bacterium]
LHGHRATMPEYVEWIEWTEEVLLKKMPIRNYLWMNCVAASLTEMAKDLEIPHEIDVVDYLRKLKQEVSRLELQGVDMKAPHDATLALYRKLPGEIQEVVRNPGLCGHPSAGDILDGVKSFQIDWASMPAEASGLGKSFQLVVGDVEGFSNTLSATDQLESWLLGGSAPGVRNLEKDAILGALGTLSKEYSTFAILGTNALANFVATSLGERVSVVSSVDYFEDIDRLPCGKEVDYLNRLSSGRFDCLISTVVLSEVDTLRLKALCEEDGAGAPFFLTYEDFMIALTRPESKETPYARCVNE